MISVAAPLACDVGDLDLQVYDPAGADWGDGGWFRKECSTERPCEAGQCCVSFLGTSCEDLVWTGPTQSICFMSGGDPSGWCFCVPPQPEPMCPGWFLQPPAKPACEPLTDATCRIVCDQKLCVCAAGGGGLPTAGVEVPSCPPPDWSIPCPGTDGGVAD